MPVLEFPLSPSSFGLGSDWCSSSRTPTAPGFPHLRPFGCCFGLGYSGSASWSLAASEPFRCFCEFGTSNWPCFNSVNA